MRGVDTCAASQVEHLYSKENVDLMICCNCPTPEDVPRDYERSKAYGPSINKIRAREVAINPVLPITNIRID